MTTTMRTVAVGLLAIATLAASTFGVFALLGGQPQLAAGAQQQGCWTNVWGTDNDGHFFTILAGDGCPDFRGRVFAGEQQRGPTIAGTGGRAKMTGVAACDFDAIEVKAVGLTAEVVLYRFKWTPSQLGCGGDSDPTPTPTPTPREPEGEPAPTPDYVPFPGTQINVRQVGDSCVVTVAGPGNETYDVTLNGILRLTNGTFAAKPFFSFWIGPDGGDRWTPSSFHAASLTTDCSVDVFRTLDGPTVATPPLPAAPAPTVATTSTTAASATTTPATTTTTGGTTTTTTTAVSTEPGASSNFRYVVTIDAVEVVFERCGLASDGLVCISTESGVWINVDSIEGGGTFHSVTNDVIVYQLEGTELSVRVRTVPSAEPTLLVLNFGTS